MSEKMYYWGQEKEPVDPEQTFIEFSAKPAVVVVEADERGGEESSSPPVAPEGPPPPPLPPTGIRPSVAVPRRVQQLQQQSYLSPGASLRPVASSCSLPGGQEAEVVVGEAATLDEERGGWGNKLDFLFSCISVSVGLGNIWRFPYLCYKNGGGAFLITYGIAMVLCGIPIFFQEVAIGQYLGAGGMTLVGQLCPILQGVGYATMTIVFFLDVYYCVIIAWTLFYLINTFMDLPGLPWEDCDNWWNTPSCFAPGMNATVVHNRTNQTTTPVEEYWDSAVVFRIRILKTTAEPSKHQNNIFKRVLQISGGIEEIGGMQWELLGCLLLGWGLVYLIIRRGLHQSGKIVWFTALFPYAVLMVLLVRSVTLSGASDGLLYYITPRWEELLGSGPWIDGATQIFFAYSIGTGALPALGSYNKFHHNCYKDAIITCIVNTMTCLLAGIVTFSILGHIALEQDTHVSQVVKSGPGLVFLTYPEVVLKLFGSVAWSAIFFSMLVILGIDSEFCIVESFVTGMVDNWPELLRPHRNKFTFGICCLMFCLGIPMVTHGGAYIFQLMDFYSASGMSLLWVCFFQTIAISWIFGAKKFCDCVHQMMGIRPNFLWYICWVVFAPAVMMFIFFFYCVQYEPIKYGNTYEYPVWAEVLGVGMSVASMIWIPVYAVYYVISQPGSIKENFLKGLQPRIKSRAKIPKGEKSAVIPMSESSAGLLSKNNSFLNQ